MPTKHFAVRDLNRFIAQLPFAVRKDLPPDFFQLLYADGIETDDGDPIEWVLDVDYELFCEGPCDSDSDDSTGYFDPEYIDALRREFPHATRLQQALDILLQYIAAGSKTYDSADDAIDSISL